MERNSTYPVLQKEERQMNETANRLIKLAEEDNRKGNYGVYSWYKMQLEDIGLTAYEYEQCCREIARALRI